MKAQRDAGHGVVHGDGDGPADSVEARAVEVDLSPARRREDPRLMTELLEPDGKVADVVVHATWRREVVRRDKPDPHGVILMAIRPRSGAGRATAPDGAGCSARWSAAAARSRFTGRPERCRATRRTRG